MTPRKKLIKIWKKKPFYSNYWYTRNRKKLLLTDQIYVCMYNELLKDFDWILYLVMRWILYSVQQSRMKEVEGLW